MDVFTLRMHLAALRQLLRDQSAEMSEEQRLKVWEMIEVIQDAVEALENSGRTGPKS